MKNIYIFCEGQTEESFVNNVLYPYFINNNIFVYPIVFYTKQKGNLKYRGGVSTYGKIKKELIEIAKKDSGEFVTTMFDYYGMPEDTPGINDPYTDIYEHVNVVENKINDDIALENCQFHFMLHECESILFSDPDAFGLIADDKVVSCIKEIRESFQNPELINDSIETAPSKRIKAIIPNYAKVLNGVILSKEIGIDRMKEECPHFREWIDCLMNL